MSKINSSYLKDRFLQKQYLQVGDKVRKNTLKPEQMKFRYQGKADGTPDYNANLVSKGSPNVQKYQKMLNETYGTFLAEDGAWGPETQKAYERFIVNKETPQPYAKGNLRPYLGEFKKFYERMPSYNYGYESLTDVDPRIKGVQQGTLTKERFEQIQALPNEEELKKSYIGKTFGGLPMFEGTNIYEGYSPSRTWTSAYGPYIEDWDSRNIVKELKTNPRYAYILTPKRGTTLEKNISNPVTMSDYLDYDRYGNITNVKDPKGFKAIIDYVSKDSKLLENKNFKYTIDDFKAFEDKDWTDVEKLNKVLKNSFFARDVLNSDNYRIPTTPIFWLHGKKMISDFQTNPEIVQYAKEKGIDLSGKSQFTNQLAEGIVAQRDAASRPFGFAGSFPAPVVQDPNMFDLAGYIPITEDMFYPYPVDKEVYMRSYWDDPQKRKEYLRKAGVPEDQLDKAYIHTSTFPIQEYKPLKNEKGEIYKRGGKVKSRLKTSYKTKHGNK